MRRLLPLVFMLATLPLYAQQTERPTLADANRLRGLAQVEEALKAYEAILAAPADADEQAQALLGIASIHLSRDPDKALACYRKITALAQANAALRRTAWLQIASLARNGGDNQGAREALKHVQTDFPEDPETVLLAGLQLAALDLENGEATVAVAGLRELLKTAAKSPRLPEVYLLLTQALAATGNWQGAAAAARAGWAKFPDRTDLMLNLAALYEQHERLAETAGVLREVLTRKPEQPELFRSLYEAEKQQAKLPALATWLDKQAQGDALGVTWLRHLSRLHEWESDLPAALRVQERIVQRRATDPRVLEEAAQVALQAKAFDRADKWLEQAQALEPDNPSLVVMAGEVRLRQGHPDQALALWKRGLKYDPKNPQNVNDLGNLVGRYGLYEQAVQLYLEARALAGRPEMYALNLAQVYETSGNLAAAVKEYVLALSPSARANVSLANMRLNRLAEDEQARPILLQTLEELSTQDQLGDQGIAVLAYARALAGPEGALEALNTLPPQTLRNLLPRIAARAESAGRPEVAIAGYQLLLQQTHTPDYAAALTLHVAELQRQQGQWRAALTTLEALHSQGLQSDLAAQIALERGELLLRRARKPSEALGAYNQVIELQPDGPLTLKARWGEGDVAFALGKYGMALATYHELLGAGESGAQSAGGLDLTPAGAPPRPRRVVLPGADYVQAQEAEVLLREGKYKEAEAAFRQFAKDNAASPYANDALERVLLLEALQKDQAGAERYLQAVGSFERGDTEHAVQLLAAITASPLTESAQLLLGEIRLWEGNSEAALKVLDALAAAEPPGPLAPQARYLAAMSLLLTNRPEARQRLEALVEKCPQSPQAEQAKVVLESWRRQAEKQ